MQNWHEIESEAAFRRQEWERTAAADARAALANHTSAAPRRRSFPRVFTSGLPWDRLTLFRFVIVARSLVRHTPGCTAASGD
jgi:hypothetical protein